MKAYRNTALAMAVALLCWMVTAVRATESPCHIASLDVTNLPAWQVADLHAYEVSLGFLSRASLTSEGALSAFAPSSVLSSNDIYGVVAIRCVREPAIRILFVEFEIVLPKKLSGYTIQIRDIGMGLGSTDFAVVKVLDADDVGIREPAELNAEQPELRVKRCVMK